jgi:ankyrin repeat protein
MSPVMVSAANGHEDCVRLLLDKQADVDAKDDGGWTALVSRSLVSFSRSLVISHTPVFFVLLTHPPITMCICVQHYAAWYGHLGVAQTLVHEGLAEIKIKDNDKATPLQLAETQNNENVALFLEEVLSGRQKQEEEEDAW